jgi:hypothetical protein
MRWLFLFLVVLNIVYLGWELNRERSPQTPGQALPQGVARIVLLQELEPERIANETIAQAGDNSVQQQEIETATAAAQSPQPIVSAKTELPPSERASTDAGAVVTEDSQKAEVAEAKPAGDLCYTLGPFSEMKTLRLVTREIKDYVVEASFRSREEQEQSMFRVFLKPVGSKQDARALTKELVSKNIRDYFIITDGPNKNGISLGYFSDKGRAYRHAERVRKLGFDAIAEPVFRTYTIYWLDYRIEAGNEIPQQIFDKHLESSAQRLSRSCS